MKRFLNKKGFSLIELMIVVGIMAILTTLAVPRFKAFQAKARQAEAKNTLSHIYTLEMAYHVENDSYQTMNIRGRKASNGSAQCSFNTGGAKNLGFSIHPCSGTDLPRYEYQVTSADINTAFIASAQTGTGTHQTIVAGCATADIFHIDQDKILTHDQDGIGLCL